MGGWIFITMIVALAAEAVGIDGEAAAVIGAVVATAAGIAGWHLERSGR